MKHEIKIKLIGGVNIDITTDMQFETIVEAFTTKDWVRVENHYINANNILHFKILVISKNPK